MARRFAAEVFEFAVFGLLIGSIILWAKVLSG
jgi:hypothetical protein